MAEVAAREQDGTSGGECGKLTFKKATLGEDREINTQTFPDGSATIRVSSNRKKTMV